MEPLDRGNVPSSTPHGESYTPDATMLAPEPARRTQHPRPGQSLAEGQM